MRGVGLKLSSPSFDDLSQLGLVEPDSDFPALCDNDLLFLHY